MARGSKVVLAGLTIAVGIGTFAAVRHRSTTVVTVASRRAESKNETVASTPTRYMVEVRHLPATIEPDLAPEFLLPIDVSEPGCRELSPAEAEKIMTESERMWILPKRPHDASRNRRLAVVKVRPLLPGEAVPNCEDFAEESYGFGDTSEDDGSSEDIAECTSTDVTGGANRRQQTLGNRMVTRGIRRNLKSVSKLCSA